MFKPKATNMFGEVRKSFKRSVLRSRDITNMIRYGLDAPKYAERIWVRPQDIHYALYGRSDYATCSGRVIEIEKEFVLIDVHNTPRMKSCFAHWVEGVPWESTEDYMTMLAAIRAGKDWAGCRTEDDLHRRYENLDNIFQLAKSSRRLKTRKELDPKAFREEGGILVSIGRHAEPLLYDGFHRLAIALILGLPIIPAQLGNVDRSAVDELEAYRSVSHS